MLNKSSVRYLSPLPGSRYNKTQTNIILKFKTEITSPNFSVSGSKSGLHEGRVVITGSSKTVLFYPSVPFETNETVTVNFSSTAVNPLKFSFQTEKKDLAHSYNAQKRMYEDILKVFGAPRSAPPPVQKENQVIDDLTLPGDYPVLDVEQDKAFPGVVSFAPFGIQKGVITPNYMIILDNYGFPLFYRKTPAPILDFKKQNNGLLTYFDMGSSQYFIMNDQCRVIDSVSMQNGYLTDLHELVITDEGHYLLMSYDPQVINMDSVVTGGKTDASVLGLVFQELDENKNLLFQWRSWDHYQITDATIDIDLTADEIDYVHANAIELDNDGNFLLSCRHMDEITKINRETGDIIWRWGGPDCENNQFTFVNDSLGFSHQHDIRRLPNGNLTLFDNGNLHPVPFSRAVEYTIDEDIKTAALVWEHRNNPLTYSIAMGNARRLDNGNTFIGWGWNSGPPSISEVRPDGSNALYIALPDTLFNYRAFKFPWETTLFSTEDSLQFEKTNLRDSSEVFLNVRNNSSDSIYINGAYMSNPDFRLSNTLPEVLAAGEMKQIGVKFNPHHEGNYTGRLYLKSSKGHEMLARVIHLSAFADTTATAVNDQNSSLTYSLDQNYPNPFNPVTVIKYTNAHDGLVRLKIYDILGNEVAVLKNEVQKAGSYEVTFSAENLSSGIYFYKLETGTYSSTKKMLLLR